VPGQPGLKGTRDRDDDSLVEVLTRLSARCAPLLRRRYLLVAVLGALVGLAHRSSIPTDYTMFGAAGSHLWTGQWGSIYWDKTLQAGPLQLAVLGAFWGLRQLASGLDVAVLNVVGCAGMATGLMWCGGRLRRALGAGSAPGLELAVAALALLWGWAGEPSSLGHLAQVVIPMLWLGAALLLRRERPVLAGVALGAASGFETWALLGLAVVTLAAGWRPAVRCLVTTGLTSAVIWLPFVVAGPFRMLQMQWELTPNTLDASLFGGDRFTVGMRLAQLLVAVAVSALVAATNRGPDAVWVVPLTALVVRLAFDPLQYSYYWLAPVTLLLVVVIGTIGVRWDARALVVLALGYCQVLPMEGAAKNETVLLSLVLLLVLGRLSRRREVRPAEVPARAPAALAVDLA
jgi:hypothetical protein